MSAAFSQSREQFIEVMAKHLPPSSSGLRLLDIGGACGAVLQRLRPDLQITVGSLRVADWHYAEDAFDAVAVFDLWLTPELLAAMLRVLRPGGRMIAVQPAGVLQEAAGRRLELAQYVRILAEPALAGQGLLLRGERAHETADTLARIGVGAAADEDRLTLDTYRGRFVYVLIRQTPNKPPWRMLPDESIQWEALAVQPGEGNLTLLTFSSLPKAVAFMQQAILAGKVRDIHKVARFSRETARQWPCMLVLNPGLELLEGAAQQMIEMSPASAEAPEE